MEFSEPDPNVGGHRLQRHSAPNVTHPDTLSGQAKDEWQPDSLVAATHEDFGYSGVNHGGKVSDMRQKYISGSAEGARKPPPPSARQR